MTAEEARKILDKERLGDFLVDTDEGPEIQVDQNLWYVTASSETDMPEQEPEFDALNLLLEHLYPTMTLLEYKRLIRQFVKVSYGRKREYGVEGFRRRSITLSNLTRFCRDHRPGL